jgi:chemotaxis protein histidine kinase CheA
MAKPTARIQAEGGDDSDVVKRATAAFAEGADDFVAHASMDIERARASLERAEADPTDPSALDAIFSIGHNLKGTGRLFGYDLLTRVSESLCDYLRDRAANPRKDLRVVGLHVASLAFVIENNIRGRGGDAGERLLAKLAGARPR